LAAAALSLCRLSADVQGKIEFGVINQSQSAFNHVLSDLSLVVYQVRGYILEGV
jgi:ABC-type uncharacterized transport system fused permease/ATPase subunit